MGSTDALIELTAAWAPKFELQNLKLANNVK